MKKNAIAAVMMAAAPMTYMMAASAQDDALDFLLNAPASEPERAREQASGGQGDITGASGETQAEDSASLPSEAADSGEV